MNDWYNTLSPRERMLVTYGSIAVLAVLAWLLVIKPLYGNKIKLEKAVTQQKTTLAKMQKQSIEIKELQQNTINKPQTSTTQNPQQLIERSLQTWRLKKVLERMQSQGSNGVRIVLTNANADRVMRFLHELETTHLLTIDNLAIDRDSKEQGYADFRLTIKRNQSNN